MILSIAKEKTITPKALKNKDATVTFKVPNAVDMERLISEKPDDAKVFTEFVVKHDFTDEAGIMIPVKDIPILPGAYPLVTEVANAVLRAGMLGPDEKK